MVTPMDRIDPRKTVSIADRSWVITRAGPEEQFEIECIMLRMLGPAAAVGVGIVVDALAKEVAGFLADVTWKGEAGEGGERDFDLARLLGDIDTGDKRIAKAWQRLLDVLPDVAGNLLGEALPVFLSRLDVKDLHRLMALAVFGKVLVHTTKGPARVTDYKTLGAVLVGQSPVVKWRLLAEAIRFNYADDLAWAMPVAGTSTAPAAPGPVSEVAAS